ncbi:SapC family protein [Segnochrobactrum spirostomi]|uniref:SapC family protein n=1 Tax=Segnochrobactrum spirostomi TaxID=2608987 RepID=A0A6A7YCD6_9HYPH|nr:SapC family protein [Segnochrobactrum spirostomi]MQT15628.1 SapC family protein [Segnochrobactrum spirostomi]
MTETPAPDASLPLFYRKPILLRFQDHGAYGVRPQSDFRFAAEAIAVPLVGSEFAAAGRHYPIVFATEGSVMPLAVTGIAAGRNLFVETDGRWRSGTYIPGYVRRYPFIGMTAPDPSAPLMLGIDAESERLTKNAHRDSADALFDAAGKATDTSRNAMALCEAYALDHERTRLFGEALEANGLLIEQTAQVRYADESGASVRGFRVVNEQAYRALSPEVLADFHGKGWLEMIVLHLASQLSWQGLVEASAPAQTKAA